MSPGVSRNTMHFTQTSQKDYEELCRLDVLGLTKHDQFMEYSEFKEQLERSPDGQYETNHSMARKPSPITIKRDRKHPTIEIIRTTPAAKRIDRRLQLCM